MLQQGLRWLVKKGCCYHTPWGSTPPRDMFTSHGLAYLHKGLLIVYGTSYKSYAILEK